MNESRKSVADCTVAAATFFQEEAIVTTEPGKDVLFIGGGPGGYAGAIYAAKKGLSVILVEKRWIGGTCLNAGCIPTKALIHAADRWETVRTASRFGVISTDPILDWPMVQAQKDKTVDTLRSGIRLLLEKNGVKILEGTAEFLDERTVQVRMESGVETLRPSQIVIATGSKTKHLPIPGLESPLVTDSEGVLQWSSLPQRLVVIGGGVIGMEFAFLFGRLGVKVQVLEFLPQILPSVDADIATRLVRLGKASNVTVVNGAKVLSVASTPAGTATVTYEHQGVVKTVEGDRVLEAVGRGPELSGFGWERIGLERGKNGGIAVDARMRTNLPHIHAIGDCTNLMQLAHVASHQAIAAVDDILGLDHPMDYRFIPSVIFTTPEIAQVGATEKSLTETGTRFRVVKIPYGSNGKALIENELTGFVKVLCDEETGRWVGATVMGAHANALIATLTVAMHSGLSAEEIKHTVFAHPTVSELIHEAALSLQGEAIHVWE